MAAPALAKTLWPHLETGWDDIAELETPGIAAKLAAVRAGTASTSTLNVTAAVKVLSELADPEAAAAGDTRVAVRAALGERHAATTPKKRTTPSERLFAGTPDDVVAALKKKRSVTPALSAAYRGASPEVRDATWELMLWNATSSRVAADVLAERAETLGVGAAATIHEYVHRAVAGTPARRRVGIHDSRCRPLIIGLRAVLTAWLDANNTTGAPWCVALEPTDDTPLPFDTPPEPSAAAGLGALAAVLGVVVHGPDSVAEGALAATGAGLAADLGTAGLTIGASTLTWKQISSIINFDELAARGALNFLSSVAAAGSARAAADGINELYSAARAPERVTGGTCALISEADPALEPGAAVRLWAATWAGCEDGNSHWVNAQRRGWTEALIAHLAATTPAAAGAVRDTLNEPHCAAATVAAAHALIAAAGAAHSDAIDVLFEHVVDTCTAGDLAGWAAQAPNAAWVRGWARHLDTLITEAVGVTGNRVEMWTATLTILDGFNGPSSDAVAVAAGVCGE